MRFGFRRCENPTSQRRRGCLERLSPSLIPSFPASACLNGKLEILRILAGRTLRKNWNLAAHSWYFLSFQGFCNCLQTSRKHSHLCCKGHQYVGSARFALPLSCRSKPIYATKPPTRSDKGAIFITVQLGTWGYFCMLIVLNS